MLLQKLKDDSLTARKARESDKATLLVTLLAEASRDGKDANRESTDEEVIKAVRKFIKNLQETLAVLPESKTEARALAEFELSILNGYLPKQATEEELKEYISDFVKTLADKSPKQMGAVMKALKAKFEGNYDGNVASALVKAALV